MTLQRPSQTFKAADAAPRLDQPHQRAVDLIRSVCGLAGSLTFLDDIRADAQRAGIASAVADGNTPKIFDWMLEAFSFQGISDQVARGYLRKHGSATWQTIKTGFGASSPCPLLQTYWHFDGCRYDKGSVTCSHIDHIDTCPVPRHRLRNGRLNQTAYSFFLFVRDIANNDLIEWIDDQLGNCHSAVLKNADPAQDRQERLIGPLRNIYGVSDKILTMTLSELLIGGAHHKALWFDTGKGMIAIDTLVHNFLHRSGILEDVGASHRYGVGCYAPRGCADIIRAAASAIDASTFNPRFPKVFPRFVQHAIWRFCAGGGLNICNGNQIDDLKPCLNDHCQLYNKCSHKPLKL